MSHLYCHLVIDKFLLCDRHLSVMFPFVDDPHLSLSLTGARTHLSYSVSLYYCSIRRVCNYDYADKEYLLFVYHFSSHKKIQEEDKIF